MVSLYNSLDKCKAEIGLAIAEVLGMPSDCINNMTKDGDVLMRAIHYPASAPKEAIWAGAHTDINLFTLLPRSTAKGLQVQKTDGEWIDVIVPVNAFVINCGDMLQRLTAGVLPSTSHRVLNPSPERAKFPRYSYPFFLHFNNDMLIEALPGCAKESGNVQPPITAADYLMERLIEIGLVKR